MLSSLFESTPKSQGGTTDMTRKECMRAMSKKSSHMTIPHCPADWDPHAFMCWPPTPAGMTTELPCPSDGYLNADNFAFRKCLPNATWYVNHTFDDNPFTFFDDCFLPVEPKAEDDLRRLVSHKILMILMALDKYTKLHLPLNLVAIGVLVLSIVLCIGLARKFHKEHKQSCFYIILILAAASLLVNKVIYISVSTVEDASKVIICRVAKALVSFSSLVFYECLFGYVFLCVVPILDYALKPLAMNLAILVASATALLLVASELALDIVFYPDKYCGFGTLQTSYHWLTTTPKFLLILCILCLDSVAIYGAFCLKELTAHKTRARRHVRQGTVCAMITVFYSLVCEILLAFIHSAIYMDVLDSTIHIFIHVYTVMVALQGIFFALILCFMDTELWSLLPCNCLRFSGGLLRAKRRDIDTQTTRSLYETRRSVTDGNNGDSDGVGATCDKNNFELRCLTFEMEQPVKDQTKL